MGMRVRERRGGEREKVVLREGGRGNKREREGETRRDSWRGWGESEMGIYGYGERYTCKERGWFMSGGETKLKRKSWR
jgi:hypothetical protein